MVCHSSPRVSLLPKITLGRKERPKHSQVTSWLRISKCSINSIWDCKVWRRSKERGASPQKQAQETGGYRGMPPSRPRSHADGHLGKPVPSHNHLFKYPLASTSCLNVIFWKDCNDFTSLLSSGGGKNKALNELKKMVTNFARKKSLIRSAWSWCFQ